MERISIENWQKNFAAGTYESPDIKTQIAAGWYDWFCKDTSLKNKTYKMGAIIAKVKEGGKVDLKTSYCWFKNNCPINGPLYDDFRFADLETGNVLLTIQVNCCFNKSRYTVYGRKSVYGKFHTDEPLFESNSSKELVKWLNEPWTERQKGD